MASTIRNLAAFLLAAQALLSFTPRTSAFDFHVGGKDGWGQSPSETYSSWAARNRFQINDKLVFMYNKGEDSVLLVNKEDYESCNASNPMRRMEDGNSVFQLDRSGHLFFISGVHERCVKGEKMAVTVMSAKHGAKTTVSPPLPMAMPPSLSHSPSPMAMPPSLHPSAAPSPLPTALAPTLQPPSAAPSPSVAQSAPPSAAPPPPVVQSASFGGVPTPAPAPAPVTGDGGSSSRGGLRVGWVSVGYGAIVLMFYYVFHV